MSPELRARVERALRPLEAHTPLPPDTLWQGPDVEPSPTRTPEPSIAEQRRQRQAAHPIVSRRPGSERGGMLTSDVPYRTKVER